MLGLENPINHLICKSDACNNTFVTNVLYLDAL